MDPLSDWDRPISPSELEAIEAALDSAAASLKRRTSSSSDSAPDLSSPAKNSRRLPDWANRPPSESLDHNRRWVLSPRAGGDSSSEVQNGKCGGSSSESYPRYRGSGVLRPHQSNVKVKYPAIKFGGNIVYCRTFLEVQNATAELLKSLEAKQRDADQIPIGFDLEWKPNFRRGEVPNKVALMQICGDISTCYVFHIIHSGIPPNLQSLLEDPKYVKVGVCIGGDAEKVLNDYNIHVNSLEDLSSLANQKLGGVPRRWSLASLTEMLTCKELEKPSKIRLGNWEVKVLSKDHLMYAATDAFVSWHLYQILKSFPDLPTNQTDEKDNVTQPDQINPQECIANVKAKYPEIKFGGNIVYCRTFSEVEKSTEELLKSIEAKQRNTDQIPLGFDIEWKPNFRRGEVLNKVALVQICEDISNCYVFHIIHSGIPPNLQSLLENPKCVKVGVCIADDADKLLNDYNVRVNPLEDLSTLATHKLGGIPRRWSLASLTEMLTCKELEKPNNIRLGNWEVEVLSKDQLTYAATDAFVSWHLYQILKSFPDLPTNQMEEKDNVTKSDQRI